MCLGLSKINTQGFGYKPYEREERKWRRKEEKSENGGKIAFQPIYSE
jgi:hypothetical protein